jgi:hypothetical protein
LRSKASLTRRSVSSRIFSFDIARVPCPGVAAGLINA